MNTEHSNFRDVGVWLNMIASQEILGERQLMRGGAIERAAKPHELCHAATIVSLKGSPNAHPWAMHIHAPKPDNGECYQTGDREVRAWLRDIVLKLIRPPAAKPILIHCHAGRDRTGVAVGTILTLLNIQRDIIIEEFLLSDNASRIAIETALKGLGDPLTWIKGEDVAALRALFGKE